MLKFTFGPILLAGRNLQKIFHYLREKRIKSIQVLQEMGDYQEEDSVVFRIMDSIMAIQEAYGQNERIMRWVG